MVDATFPRLLGDVGGTHARFAWLSERGAPLASVVAYRCEQEPTLLAAIERYRREHRLPLPASAAIGIANPVTGDAVRMTNHHWSFSIAELERALGVRRLAVLNDFTALAHALTQLGAADLHRIGAGEAVPRMPIALLGAGTGLGVSGLLPTGTEGHVALAGEGGHVTLAAADDEEAAVIERLRQRFGHVSAERALSGPGLANLHAVCAERAGRAAPDIAPGEVVARARAGTCADSRAAVDLFCRFLGSVAGNLALTLGARGGVYVGGGIAPRLLPEMETSRFRERFEGKGRFQAYLARIPTLVITAQESPALLGASRALDLEAAGAGV